MDTQQTRDIDPMLLGCWADVEDGGPTSKQQVGQCLVFAGQVLVYITGKGKHVAVFRIQTQVNIHDPS